MKVLLDTNVIVSAVTTRGLCADVLRTVLAEHELLICPQILAEVRRTLRTKFFIPVKLTNEYLQFLQQDAILVEPLNMPSRLNIRDKEDVAIISAALHGKADIFVTGDKELQDIKIISRMRILSPRAFWEEMTAQTECGDDS